MKEYIFDICVPDDLPAGLSGFTDEIKIIVKSGDACELASGEFAKYMKEALVEWYDVGGGVKLRLRTKKCKEVIDVGTI